MLVARPGLLTLEYFAGRRKRYLKPVQLFIFCNVIFFFFQSLSGYNSLRTPLQVHLYRLPYSRFARQLVGKVLVQRGTPFAEYQAVFNSTIETQAKTLVFLMIPMFAVGLAVLYLRRREYMVKHLVFAVHFFSFYLLWNSFIYGLIALINLLVVKSGLAGRFSPGDAPMSLIILGGSLVYLLVAVRRVYEQGWALTVLKSLGLIVILMVVVQSYRFVLFLTTYLSV